MITRVRMSSTVLNVVRALLIATLVAQPALSKELRFPQLTPDQLNEQQKALAARFPPSSGSGLSPIGGPFNLLLRSPELGHEMVDLNLGYLATKSSVPVKLREIAMLMAGAQWRAEYVWRIHSPIGLKAGLSPDTVEAIRKNKRPAKMAKDEAVVYDFVSELSRNKKVSDATFARAKEILNDQQIVDLTVCFGNYIVVSMMLAMAEDTLPGKEGAFD